MRIQYCSDLHLEFAANSAWLEANPIKPVGEILLVAGDTFYLGKEFKNHEWFDYASANWRQVYLIPGNHEFYGGYDASICLERDYKLEVRNNVTLLNNTSIELENVRLVFSTMWSRIEKEVGAILGDLNDFRLIQISGKRLNIEMYNELFQESRKFLEGEMNHATVKKKVFLTHHLPSEQCVLPMYKGSRLSEAFMIDLSEEILASNIDYWIYGHSHGNIENFKIGSTELLTNQLGYIEAGGSKYFKGNTFFEI